MRVGVGRDVEGIRVTGSGSDAKNREPKPNRRTDRPTLGVTESCARIWKHRDVIYTESLAMETL